MSTTYSQFMMRTAVHSGAGARAVLPDLFRGMGAKRVVLFSDRGLEKAGLVDKVVEIFKTTPRGSGPELTGVFLDIEQDAASTCVNSASAYVRQVGGDSLLALGGGSVLDTVKGVKYSIHKGLTDVNEAIPGGLAFHAWPEANFIPIPHIAVPTTAGTGAEVSPIAVIYNEAVRLKTNLIHPFINADMAVLDPELTVGLPPRITAFTGFDALTHAVEALASPTATPFTDAYALHAVRLIQAELPKAVRNGNDLNARMQLLQASTMAITAFSFALSAIPVHNFAHAYGALFRIPHGLANAVFLPHVMELLPQLYLPKIASLAEALGLDVRNKSPELVHVEVVQKVRDLLKEVGLPNDFHEFTITREGLEQTVRAVAADPAGVFFRLPPDLIRAVGERVSGIAAVSSR